MSINRRGFDPAQNHYWDQIEQRGEWPRLVIAPLCTPSERRVIHPDDIGDAPDDVDDVEGAVCEECVAVHNATAPVSS